MSRLWALVPLKNLARVKTRLAEALPFHLRKALAIAMARDVAAALARSRAVERVVLVSDIPDLPGLLCLPSVASFAGTGAGLNEDLAEAALWAGRQGATRILIAHADLPLLTPAAVDRFAAPDRGAVSNALRAACCKNGTGTNLLLAPLPLPVPLVFGNGSFARFQAAAAVAGIPFDVCRDPLLAADVDDPADYAALEDLCRRGALRNTATAALLRSRRSGWQRTASQAALLRQTSGQERLVLS